MSQSPWSVVEEWKGMYLGCSTCSRPSAVSKKRLEGPCRKLRYSRLEPECCRPGGLGCAKHTACQGPHEDNVLNRELRFISIKASVCFLMQVCCQRCMELQSGSCMHQADSIPLIQMVSEGVLHEVLGEDTNRL